MVPHVICCPAIPDNVASRGLFYKDHPPARENSIPLHGSRHHEPWIPDKTTWESFPLHVHFPTQQNYFQNDAFAERKPLPPIQCCFLQTPRDQAFFWIHNNIAFRGRGRGNNRYSYDVRCLEKCSPSIQFSQQFCPRLALPVLRTCFITSVMKKKERTPFWPEPLTGGSSWEVDPPVVNYLNSLCNPHFLCNLHFGSL